MLAVWWGVWTQVTAQATPHAWTSRTDCDALRGGRRSRTCCQVSVGHGIFLGLLGVSVCHVGLELVQHVVMGCA
eukprot:10451270-Alexandrium_andersonii.AAC.1